MERKGWIVSSKGRLQTTKQENLVRKFKFITYGEPTAKRGSHCNRASNQALQRKSASEEGDKQMVDQQSDIV